MRKYSVATAETFDESASGARAGGGSVKQKPVEARGMDALEALQSSAPPLALILIGLAPSGAPAVAERFVAMVEAPFLESDSAGEEVEE